MWTIYKNLKNRRKYKETVDSRYIYQNELDKACFQHDMASGDFKNLTRRAASDKILRDKAFNIAKYPKYDGYQGGPASMAYKFFDKKTSSSGIKNETISNKKLAQELQKPIIRNFKKRKVHSVFINKIWSADPADMQLIKNVNKGFRFVLCVIDIFSEYEWLIPLKNKEGITTSNVFQNVLNESKSKPNKR